MSTFIAWLAWLFSDPQAFDAEHPRAAAAVLVASASLEFDGGGPPPAPPPPEDSCCKDCGGTGKIRHPDGHSTDCPCDPSCRCKKR